MTTTPRTVTNDDLRSFCAKLADKNARYFAEHYSNLTAPVFTFDPKGRKYVRIVRTEMQSVGRSVVCFVERSTGLIWKAASWKAPAKNFSRGSIFETNNFADGDNIYGC